VIKITLYGRLADALGREFDLDAPAGISIGEIRERLATERPEIADVLSSGRCRACVGKALVADGHRPGPHDYVEFLAPVSGG
jgi:molybdopterin converting factor small subunit